MAFILGIIPARGGSKSIPNKNIREIRGKSLLAYTIEAAQGSSRLSDYLLSTDSQIIADCAASYGLKTSALRPSELATETAKVIDVVIYELVKYESEKGLRVDIIVLLQPTTPMRTAVDIDDALDIFSQSEASSLISVCEVGNLHPNTMYYCIKGRLTPVLEEGKKFQRRQEFTTVYWRNGALYIATKEQVIKRNSLVSESPAAYIMPRERSANIDEPYDLELAEWMMSRMEKL